VLLAFDVVSLVPGSIRPGLNAMAVLLVVLPFASVLSPVCVRVGAFAVSLVSSPATLIDITVGVNEPTLAFCLIVHPLSLVDRAIDPHLDACSAPLLFSLNPLAFVLAVVLQ
jgi:hypothetical protein